MCHKKQYIFLHRIRLQCSTILGAFRCAVDMPLKFDDPIRCPMHRIRIQSNSSRATTTSAHGLSCLTLAWSVGLDCQNGPQKNHTSKCYCSFKTQAIPRIFITANDYSSKIVNLISGNSHFFMLLVLSLYGKIQFLILVCLISTLWTIS